jgi:hypothetical protein
MATGSDVEKANLASAAKGLEAFNKHDIPALMASCADDVVFSEAASPVDRVGKKAVEKSHQELFKAFSDVKLEIAKSWAAGDYLVFEGSFVGTNDGPMPSAGIKKATGKRVSARFLEIDKIVGGKLKNIWIFDNGMSFAAQLGLLPPPPAPKPAAAAKPGAAPAAASAGAPAAAKPGAPAAAAAPAAAPAAKPAPGPAPATPAAKPAPAASGASGPAMKPATPAPAAPTVAKPATPAPAAPGAAKPATPAAPTTAKPAPATPVPAPAAPK